MTHQHENTPRKKEQDYVMARYYAHLIAQADTGAQLELVRQDLLNRIRDLTRLEREMEETTWKGQQKVRRLRAGFMRLSNQLSHLVEEARNLGTEAEPQPGPPSVQLSVSQPLH